MITSTFSSGRAIASVKAERLKGIGRYLYSTSNGPQANGHNKQKPVEPSVQRQLFMNVLEASATKRDAKQYLARFKAAKGHALPSSEELRKLEIRNARHQRDQDRLERVGVNLGGLYAPARAIAESPQFRAQGVQHKAASTEPDKTHVALVLFKDPGNCDDNTLDGVALTLSQLVKLDMHIMLVIDTSSFHSGGPRMAREALASQGERLCAAVQRHGPEGTRLVMGALEVADEGDLRGPDARDVHVAVPELILKPLHDGVITMVPSLAYSSDGQLVEISTSATMSALTRQLALPSQDEPHGSNTNEMPQTTIDRIIILDPAGGIPSRDRNDGAHVFLNLKQEFEDTMNELSRIVASSRKPDVQHLYRQHLDNLQITQNALNMLPSSSSALIITPEDAASFTRDEGRGNETIGAGTRLQKNTLIHNLLTNKPMVSSSLPTARLHPQPGTTGKQLSATSRAPTLVKQGMPLVIVPSVGLPSGWSRPTKGVTSLDIQHDDRVDFDRLLYLIEDSFRRRLDVQHYMDRIRGTTAGLIVAGQYEGGAILTWETPPSLKHLPASDRERTRRLVPYLDKFAVLQSSQGSAGVADILFQAMVRSCFPHGVCWRSRKDNPVNKWYFERADGSWQIPQSNWTMFWTGDGVVQDEERFADYVEVCRNVVPSWADGKKPD